MDNVYHPVEITCEYYNDFTGKTDFAFFMQSALVSHDELMALIGGGRNAIKAWIVNHSTYDYDEIIDSSIKFEYSTKRRYDRYGKSLDGGPDFKKKNGWDYLNQVNIKNNSSTKNDASTKNDTSTKYTPWPGTKWWKK